MSREGRDDPRSARLSWLVLLDFLGWAAKAVAAGLLLALAISAGRFWP